MPLLDRAVITKYFKRKVDDGRQVITKDGQAQKGDNLSEHEIS